MEERNKAKNAYKNVIDQAKRNHRDDFLANAKKNDVWMAHQFTKQRQPVKIPGGHHESPDQTSQEIMEHVFPASNDAIPLKVFHRKELEEDSRVTSGEVSEGLKKCSN